MVNSIPNVLEKNRVATHAFRPGQRVLPPVGFAHFPKEIHHPPREWLERTFNVAQWTDMPSGGHFRGNGRTRTPRGRHSSLFQALSAVSSLKNRPYAGCDLRFAADRCWRR